MKFKRYLAANQEAAWFGNYIRYGELKKLLVQVCELSAMVLVQADGCMPRYHTHPYM